jgi:hypothetical protein
LKPARFWKHQAFPLAEWLYEAGIGECRAALVENGAIIEAQIEVDSVGPRAGAIMPARLRANRIAEAEDGTEALLDFAPRGLTEGARLMIEITREALSEPGKPKRAKARAALTDAQPAPGPTLLERITASPYPVTLLSLHDRDALEEAGWSECLEQAGSGEIPFEGGALRISLTPAMTLIDVDGTLPPLVLALAGIKAAGAAIRRFGIAGSIGIDLPTLGSKAERIQVAAGLTETLPPPFETTAINGFGFIQIIRPRRRAALIERLHYDRIGAAARALLRQAQRSGRVGALTLVAPLRVEPILVAHPHWLATLGTQMGGTVSLRVDPSLGIGSGYVEG